MKAIDVGTLQNWLEQKRDLIVLDVRNDEDYQQWSIPGSIHVNAYDELKAGRPGPLTKLNLPVSTPVVTVCNLGRMAAVAAEKLEGRGGDVFVLEGGMQAWSLAWNTAEVPVKSEGVLVLQVRRTGKGCLSYLITSAGVAAVIDPSLSPEVYVGLARERGSQIAFVLDTHIHADHLSRARELAHKSGATLLLPKQNRAHYPYTAVEDRDAIPIGDARLTAIHTPGHTLESTSYLLNDDALFSGDTLFLAGVGRPDLSAEPEEARVRARLLFRSLQHLRSVRADVLLLPGHTGHPVPFDHVPLAVPIGSVFGQLKDWFLSEEEFVERILSRIPPTPPNYARIVELNETATPPPTDLAELEAGANRCAIG
jgi:glyoxylase-like metal-dependent hydrolase (beta-lactamase superfamily II)/rhodanese-related sulfurtransferase